MCDIVFRYCILNFNELECEIFVFWSCCSYFLLHFWSKLIADWLLRHWTNSKNHRWFVCYCDATIHSSCEMIRWTRKLTWILWFNSINLQWRYRIPADIRWYWSLSSDPCLRTRIRVEAIADANVPPISTDEVVKWRYTGILIKKRLQVRSPHEAESGRRNRQSIASYRVMQVCPWRGTFPS